MAKHNYYPEKLKIQIVERLLMAICLEDEQSIDGNSGTYKVTFTV